MRINWIKIFFLLFFLAISIRLFYWQAIRVEFLQAQAESQHFTNVKLAAIRGKIFFSDGTLLASSNPAYLLYGLPKVIAEDQKVSLSYTLAKIIAGSDPKEIDEIAKDIINKLSADLYWIRLENNISVEQKRAIEQLRVRGIGFEEGSVRFYPEGSTSAHLLGFVGKDAKGDDKGYFGLEGYYDGELRGLGGSVRHERDAVGLPILIGNFLETFAKDGKDLVLNIDRSVQFIVEQSLKNGLEKYGAKVASAVVMDPKTGNILALASFPNYDPLNYFEFPKEYYKNPIIADQYEPGSTFKVFIMAAALNEEIITPETKCDQCSGPVSIGGFSLRTWNNKYYPQTSMKEVIVHSDNVGMVFVGRKLGQDKFHGYLEDFGFGNPTNVDLQDDFSPNIRPKNEWREIDLATASFGQGIAVTGMQMVRAVAVIANGGKLMEPHVVNKILDEEGSFEIKSKVIREVIKASTAEQIKEMMIAAVSEGEAKFAKPKGFKIAGKTGTAQIPVAGHYDPNKTIASFVGFAPADDPKFVMLVRYDQPTSSVYGSETAAPTFFVIAKELFTYYKIAPSE